MQDQSQTGLLEFPCAFPVKVMGKDREILLGVLHDVLAKHAPETDMDSITSRFSRTGRYLSCTVTIHAHGQTQLDAIYQELTASEHVLMAL